MSNVVIQCPNRSCAAPLRLALNTINQPLSCPHCRTAIRVIPGADGEYSAEAASPPGWRVPKLLLVPGFALLILGAAGLFANGVIAHSSANDPAYAREFCRDRVADLRSGETLTGPAGSYTKSQPKAAPQDAFAAVAGAAAEQSRIMRQDEDLAQYWEQYVVNWHLIFAGVSALMLVGGYCVLRGRYYPLAILGSLAAIVNFNLMCCVPGAVAGIWGILMLVRDDGRKHFGHTIGK